MKFFITASLAVFACTLNADRGPDSHGPVGVMGDHYHKAGEIMLSYRFMLMSMRDNLNGKTIISPETIVTSSQNKFSNLPMMPATLRVTPTKMNMQMHMFCLLYTSPSPRD